MAVRYAEEAEVAFSKGGNMYQLRSKKYDIVIKNGTLIDTIGDFEKKKILPSSPVRLPLLAPSQQTMPKCASTQRDVMFLPG
ncbi:hypothetical protein RX717_14030 [Intestinibacillus sp. NTUH-41-i26]|uniref:hypothetical protein n=1 Tax=Intestinibacillus sp. NTUH-41-i26 TaxID=3079303 RepID=UPI002934D951|nr:hypothetical protein [Intestinibacillus sp. NTUH-41-i26]WOC75079.1 hypothetical protein RX717_14030 [Intestinibacillus sp. NTUH-41-i26]